LIAVLHYSPIQETVEGEPLEIFPFLGCSRLEEPLTRYPVTAVFHGHAHHGRPEGRTRTDAPVYNVSMTMMRELFPDRPFRLVDVHLPPAVGQPSEDRAADVPRAVATGS
jgi:Icc-related predicted phosphoesterase